jgi:hypothetical protein
MKKALLLLFPTALLAALFMGQKPAPASANGEMLEEAERLAVIKKAQEALLPFKKNLKGALQGAMKEGGPVAAIDACRLKAPQITQKAGGQGMKVGRTSSKLRNPKNAAPKWVAPLLTELESAPSDKPPRRVVPIDGKIEGKGDQAGKRMGYVEAIIVQPLCLTCHGSALAPGVRDALKAHYPQDQATGYGAGDFRGLFWVEMPVAAKGGG